MENLTNKIILITGASSGIGAETAKMFAQHGAKVLLIARNQSKLEQVANQIISTGGTAYIFPLDVTIPEALEATSKMIINEVGIPDIIFNNAGGGVWKFVDETTYKEAEEMIKAHVIIPVISEKQAAKIIVNGVAKRKRKIRGPFMLKVVEFFTHWTPFITRFIMDQTAYKRK